MLNAVTYLLRDMIYQSKGKIFTVWFTKSNGETRKMNCRIGVTKNLKSPVYKFVRSPETADLVTVYDMQKKAYRSFHLHTVSRIKLVGFELEIPDADFWY